MLQLFRFLWIFVGHLELTLTSVLNDRLYLGFHLPIIDLGPDPEAMEGVCTHGGGPPLIFLLSIKPPHLTLT